MESDGDRIKALMGTRKKAEFARQFKVPGGPSMISQNISGNRPVSIEGAIAYAQGFGVPIAAISPRIDTLLRTALNALDAPAPPPTVTLDAALDVLGQHLARDMDRETRAELGEALSTWARWGGKENYRNTVAALLAGNPGKQRTAA